PPWSGGVCGWSSRWRWSCGPPSSRRCVRPRSIRCRSSVMCEPVLATRDLRRRFMQREVVIDVLRGVDLEVAPGEIVALVGPSGSGKSTLLQAVGLLEGGFSGSIRLDGKEAADLDDDGRTNLRRDLLGFVYQFHH